MKNKINNVLIVDDIEHNRNILKDWVEILGHEYEEADNGRVALEKIKVKKTDLILLDIMMPVMDGLTMLKHLKSSKETKDIPVLIISSDSEIGTIVDCVNAGADDYLVKPFVPEILRARISSALEKKNLHDLEKEFIKHINQTNSFLQEKITKQAGIITETGLYTETDLYGIITDTSDSFCELSGYSKEELIGKPHSIIRHEDMSSTIFKDMWSKFENQNSWNGDILNKKKNGEIFWVRSHISPLYDKNKSHIGYISSRVDITSLKEVGKQDMLIKSQEKLAILGDMFGAISHQWKQPLQIIAITMANIKMKLELGILEDSDVSKCADNIDDTVQYLSDTMDTFKHYVQGKKELKNFPIQDELHKVVSILEPIMKSKGINLKCNYKEIENIYVKMFTNELSQVIMVLLNNAKDVLLEKSVEKPWVNLMLSSDEANNKVCITVEDNAGGIPDEISTKMFNKYFTTKDDSNGTGLGLYMSKEIVEDSLNGKIWFKNTANGAKFYIDLPLKS